MSDMYSEIDNFDAFHYNGNDLGNLYKKEATSFRVWAPTASEVTLNLYKEGSGDNLIESIPMGKNIQGTWYKKVDGDLNGVYYTYKVTVENKTNEAVDPYAKTAGVNGLRGMVIDLNSTDPEGFREVKKPEFMNPTDAIIYELHIRDLSADSSSGIKHTGKFLGLTERGTKNKEGHSTGLDHLIDLGITHLHLLPVYDYVTVDESKLEEPQFNWGYDPENYNVLEGSYSTDPSKGEVRVKEFKEMIKTLHENGIRVVMDVVYNHTYKTIDSNFNKIVPDYYYRKDMYGFSNGSGCGNETASEKFMFRKFMIDSLTFWAKEYEIDGFRFDLMGVHDIETMNLIREALDEIDPSIILYGEGWTGGPSLLPEHLKAVKNNARQLNRIAVFSDDIRDGIKGSVHYKEERGFVSGNTGMKEAVKFGIVASTGHHQVDYMKAKKRPWAKEPYHTITYTSAHDNYSLWDKLCISAKDETLEDRIKMNLLSAAIVLTSQGIPFFQAGEELLRSKIREDGEIIENSYNSSDFVNSIKWDLKTQNKEVYDYYKGLIAFRKAHRELRMETKEQISRHINFIVGMPSGVVAYEITFSSNEEGRDDIMVIFNATKEPVSVELQFGIWDAYVSGKRAGNDVLYTILESPAVVDPISAMVLVKRR